MIVYFLIWSTGLTTTVILLLTAVAIMASLVNREACRKLIEASELPKTDWWSPLNKHGRFRQSQNEVELEDIMLIVFYCPMVAALMTVSLQALLYAQSLTPWQGRMGTALTGTLWILLMYYSNSVAWWPNLREAFSWKEN
jgi:hypothetical protein